MGGHTSGSNGWVSTFKGNSVRESVKDITGGASSLSWLGDREWQVLATVHDLGLVRFTLADVWKETGLDRRRAHDVVKRLMKRGIVKKIARGLYEVTVDLTKILTAPIRQLSDSQAPYPRLEELVKGSQGQGDETGVSCRGLGRGCDCFWLGVDDGLLGYFLGVLFGDGWVCRNRVGLNAVERVFVEEFRSVAEVLGFRPSKVYRVRPVDPRWREMFRVVFNSACFVKWFKRLGVEELRELLKSDDALIGFVRGFYESEGYFDRKRYRIEISNTRRDLIVFVRDILEKFGIRARIYRMRRGKDDKRKDLYRVRLYGKDNVMKFLSLIRPSIKNGEIVDGGWLNERLERVKEKRESAGQSRVVNEVSPRRLASLYGVVVDGPRFDNVRGWRGGGFVPGDRGRVLFSGDLVFFDEVSYAEMQYLVSGVGELPEGLMVAVYTNWGQDRGGVRVEVRPPSGFVKRFGVAGLARLYWEVWLVAVKALLSLLREAPIDVLRRFVTWFASQVFGKVVCAAVSA